MILDTNENIQNETIQNENIKTEIVNETIQTETFTFHWMLMITPLAFITGVYAWYNDLKILAIAEWCLVASSIYYWSKHTDQLRRQIDMIVVQLSLYTHIAYIIWYSCYIVLLLYFCSMIAFGLGHYFDSNIAHSFVWIFGCIGNYLLSKNISMTIPSPIPSPMTIPIPSPSDILPLPLDIKIQT